MKTKMLFLSAVLFALLGKAQLYRADIVCIKIDDAFKTVASEAYLDYNTKGRYVELVFQDTVYAYKILQTNKPRDRHRFVVWFKKTDDNMLWNVTDEGDYIFGFIIDGTKYWFRVLTTPTQEEFDKYKEGLPVKKYE